MAQKSVAVITGVSREMGLGFATARLLTEAGFHVILTARDKQKAADLAGRIGADEARAEWAHG